MQDLTLVGVHDDGEHLVLVGADGTTYRVPLDEPLRTVIRSERPRTPPAAPRTDEGRLRPREIQARIRAGQTAEQIAETAGVPLDHIRRYEGPVLAEREYVAQQARKVRVRRSAGALAAPTLDDIVAQRLSHREAVGSSVEWDAWRTDDGSWTVLVSFRTGSRERRARWSYDPHVRHTVPLDDEARWLIDGEPEEPGPGAPRRLTPVRDRPHELETGAAPLLPISESAVVASTVDLLEDLRQRRGRRGRPLPPDEEAEASRDPVDDAIDALRRRSTDSRPGPAPVRSARARSAETGQRPQRPRPVADPAPPRTGRSRRSSDADILVLPDDAPLPREAPRPPDAPAEPTPARPAARRQPKGGSRAMRSAVQPELTSPDPPTRASSTRGLARDAADPVPARRSGTRRSRPAMPPVEEAGATEPAGPEPGLPGSGDVEAAEAGPTRRTAAARSAVGATATGSPTSQGASRGSSSRSSSRSTSSRSTSSRSTSSPSSAAGSAAASSGAGEPRRSRSTGTGPGSSRARTGVVTAPPEQQDEPAAQEETRDRRPASTRRNRRLSVPSWDDIVFGARRD